MKVLPRPRREAKSTDEDSAAGGPKPTLRVDLERVDRLINAVGELIINQAMIEGQTEAQPGPRLDAVVSNHHRLG